MNFKVVLVLTVIIGFTKLSAQKSELDWQKFIKSTQETQIAQPVSSGSFTIFQISNINKFLYKIEIEGKVFELQTPVPTELQTLFRLSQQDLQKTATNEKSKQAVEAVSDAIPPMAAIADDAKTMKQDAQNRIAKFTITPPIKGASDSIANSTKIKTAQSQLAASAIEVVLECSKYLELAKAISNDVFTLKNTRNKLVSIAQMDAAEATIDEMVNAIPWPIPNIESNYTELQDLYKQLELRYSELLAKAKIAKLDEDTQAEIKASLDKVEKANDLIEEETLLGLISDVDFLYNELKNSNNFKAVAPPVQMDGDMVSYAVIITPASTRSLGAYRSPMNFKFNIPAKGGLKVDFSVGPVISFGKTSRDDKIYLEEMPDSNKVILKQRSNNNAISPSIAAMMHFYSRGSHAGGMIGIGAGFQSASQIDANILAGVSYIMGKRQKLMISGGISWLRVDRLKENEFSLNKEYDASKIDIGNVTEKVFKTSVFLSVSYNLTNKVEIN